MKAEIKEVLRPDVFRIVFKNNTATEMLVDRRILYLIKDLENSNYLIQKLRDLIQNKTVNIVRAEYLSNGLRTGRIYVDGKHLSAFLR